MRDFQGVKQLRGRLYTIGLHCTTMASVDKQSRDAIPLIKYIQYRTGTERALITHIQIKIMLVVRS
jgi:hypothetical protein